MYLKHQTCTECLSILIGGIEVASVSISGNTISIWGETSPQIGVISPQIHTGASATSPPAAIAAGHTVAQRVVQGVAGMAVLVAVAAAAG